MNHKEIIQRLKYAGFKSYLVGGCVRDKLLGKSPTDYDITTEARPEQVIAIFRDRTVKKVGKSFAVVIVDDYEIATFRFDNYSDNNLTVSFADTIHEDLSRRDLTINAMAYCELSDELIDDHGGQEDLNNKIIRFVGDPIERIKEDPCRILRACRFLAVINGRFDHRTFVALNEAVVWYQKIKDIAPERIRIEILKAMKIKNASVFFEALYSIGALEYIFPSLASCWGHEHGKHHIENVWEHCMMAGDHISTKFPILKLTAYLHDCGKPRAFDKETQQFLRHEFYGATAVKFELSDLKFSLNEIRKITELIKSHMYSTQKMSNKAIRKFLKKMDERDVNIDDFFRIRMADRAANIKHSPFSLREYVDMIKAIKHPSVADIPFDVKQLALKGKDIIKEFDLVPGPIVGKIQKHLLDFVIERGPSHNNRELLIIRATNFLLTGD